MDIPAVMLAEGNQSFQRSSGHFWSCPEAEPKIVRILGPAWPWRCPLQTDSISQKSETIAFEEKIHQFPKTQKNDV
jgi:hypothetical protein